MAQGPNLRQVSWQFLPQSNFLASTIAIVHTLAAPPDISSFRAYPRSIIACTFNSVDSAAVSRRKITRVIIQYRNPRRPDEGAVRFIPNRSEVEAEKERLERLGFVIIDITPSYFSRRPV
jgi:hypothetical protein